MIVEKMEASFVLLAHRLCIPLQEVVALQKLVRKDEERVSSIVKNDSLEMGDLLYVYVE